MTKVVRIYLISKQADVDYKKVCSVLWDLQRQTREIKNKTIQLCWEWLGFSSDYNKDKGEYPKEKDVLNYSLDGFIYDHFKTGYDLYSTNTSCVTREASSKFKNAKAEMLRGDCSILSYKSNQPLELYNKAINIYNEDNKFYVKLKLLNKAGKAKHGIDGDFLFEMQVKEKSVRTVIERCIDGVYKISGSKLIYDNKKRMWCLNLSYSFKPTENTTLDKNKILGVDLGVVYPICASVHGDLNRLIIKGGEIEAFRKRVEARRLQLLEQTKYCGDGRIGHGRHARTLPAFKAEHKIEQFRNTANHKYSRALIDFAVKNGCGTIQMENLKGITTNALFLKNWSYYDLQTKIEYKAQEAGIKVVYIEPQFTSQRCSKCGFIHMENRPEQAVFKCQKCGYSANADFNASQNISIKQIDKIIAETISANMG